MLGSGPVETVPDALISISVRDKGENECLCWVITRSSRSSQRAFVCVLLLQSLTATP